MDRRPDVDDDWRDVAAQWTLRPDVTYLNHGSFGPPPRPVQKAHHDWQKRLWEEPMDFYVRQLPQAWRQARRSVAEFLNTPDENLVFVENATAGMNLVAHSFPLEAGDEVLLTDHEYGAVRRIWEKRAVQCGATVSTVRLELPFTTAAAVVEQLSDAVTPRTRLAVVSHITSPTAVILPVGEIARALHRLGVAVVVDGPHALAQVPVDLETIGCDFYTASCHKWLSAPFGSGLLYVAPAWHAHIRPLLWSWGVLPPDVPAQWWQEFVWMGTRDPSAFLAVPAAIEWMKQIGLEAFRTRTHYLAQQARKALVARFGREPLVPDDPSWYGSMAHIPLPTAAPPDLQKLLWHEYRIEVPVVEWSGDRYLRISFHLYNTAADLERLEQALVGLGFCQ